VQQTRPFDSDAFVPIVHSGFPEIEEADRSTIYQIVFCETGIPEAVAGSVRLQYRPQMSL
jgi:hypothetical protein